jgi:hypothetical protein
LEDQISISASYLVALDAPHSSEATSQNKIKCRALPTWSAGTLGIRSEAANQNRIK